MKDEELSGVDQAKSTGKNIKRWTDVIYDGQLRKIY